MPSSSDAPGSSLARGLSVELLRNAEPGEAFSEAAKRVVPPDESVAVEARARHDTLTKPPGALGRLEDLGVRLSAIAGRCPPPLPAPAAVAVFAGDHGVLRQGVSPWPAEVTAQMVDNFLAGGAAINVLARQVGAEVVVVDVGVASELPGSPGLVRAKVRAGTGDIATEPAMERDEALRALDVGATVARELVARGFRCLATGDMGIGNTTPSAALIAAFCGRDAGDVTGRGTGIDDERLATKVSVVEAALSRVLEPGAPSGSASKRLDGGASKRPDGAARAPFAGTDTALDVLAGLGGLEIAALAGYVVGAASARVPVVVDGVIAAAAAVVAAALVPGCTGYMIAGHRSSEPGASVALAHLGLDPVLDLGMRLGEGTGACLAIPALQAAARVLGEMATFDSAGVSGKHT